MTSGLGPGRLLQVTYKLFGQLEVDETLAVFEDGGVWLWSLKPYATRDRAGSFAFTLDDAELAHVQDVVAEALENPQATAAQARGAVEVVAQARGESAEGTFVLSTPDALPAPLASLRTLVDDVRNRAEGAPIAALRLAWRPAVPALRTGTAATIVFAFENVGVQPMSVLVDPEKLVVYGQGAAAWEEWWRGSRDDFVGLFDASGEMTGGPLTPGTVGAGETVNAVIANALTPPRGGRIAVGASAEGRLTLVGPDGEDEFPSGAFRLEAPQAEYTIDG